MHDQRKVKQEVDEKTRERERVEVKAFTSLYDSLLKKRDACVYTESALNELTDLLRKNPEAYSMYNYRRRILLHLWCEEKKRQERQLEASNACQKTGECEAVILSDTECNTSAVSSSSPPPSPTTTATATTATIRTEMDWLKEELKLSTAILLSDYKVYAAFVHRRWIFAQLQRVAEAAMLSHPTHEIPEEVTLWANVLQKEKKQCDALLAMDERNFHAWNYRRWALGEMARMKELLTRKSFTLCADGSVRVMNESETHPFRDDQNETNEHKHDDDDVSPLAILFPPHARSEFRFTTEMIRRNFSNYSAWHQRGLLLHAALHRLCDGETFTLRAAQHAVLSAAWAQLAEDLSLVLTAIYCDPEDQSAWYYAQFLERAAQKVRCASDEMRPNEWKGNVLDVTARLVEACVDLVAEERCVGGDAEVFGPHSYLLAVLLRGGAEVNATARQVRAVLLQDEDGDDRVRCVEELVRHLMQADALRAGMYRGMLAGVDGSKE